MIKVKRIKEPRELVVARKVEEQKNKILVKQGKPRKFGAYKIDPVKEALIKMFNEKCAYCESNFLAVTPQDIEHFRPKSSKQKKGSRSKFSGYYWLAADWTNLLLSCPSCNRPNKHLTPGATKKITYGKHYQFPLRDEKFRWISPGSKKKNDDEKERLLINPCIENPESYFCFEESGKATGNIKVKTDLSDRNLLKAEKSIEVYALHRLQLVKKRQKLIDRLNKDMLVIRREITEFNRTGRASNKRNINEYITGLLEFTENDQEYTALSKQLIKKFLQEIKGNGW